MRQVIRRFLKHLDAEKNASVTTIESYKYDLHKFDVYGLNDWETRFLPGISPMTTYEITLCGSQKSVIKNQTVPRLVPAHSQPSGRFANTPIVLAC